MFIALNKWVVVFIVITKPYSLFSVDPFSKITIKSTRATCTKNKQQTSEVVCKYFDNVHVELADHSKIQSKELEIICDLKSSTFQKSLGSSVDNKIKTSQQKVVSEKKAASHVKKIAFAGNVVVCKDEFKATADFADIAIPERTCTLKGNVHIQRFKSEKQNFPVDLKSETATIQLNSGQILLTGSSKNPVNTVINLEDHPIVRNKTDKKKRKQLAHAAAKKP